MTKRHGIASIMAIDYWFELYQAWAKLPVPSRVNHRLADFFREQVAGLDGPVLLLGFTPSLSSIATDLIAVDRNIALSKHLWPGNRPVLRMEVLSLSVTRKASIRYFATSLHSCDRAVVSFAEYSPLRNLRRIQERFSRMP